MAALQPALSWDFLHHLNESLTNMQSILTMTVSVSAYRLQCTNIEACGSPCQQHHKAAFSCKRNTSSYQPAEAADIHNQCCIFLRQQCHQLCALCRE